MITNQEHAISVGKYLVSPLVTRTDGGSFVASVAIRSGHGSATHHRVLRFVPRFDTRASARRYAVDQGMAWLRDASHSPARSSIGQGRTD
jgi:hypothetical protein